MAYFARGDVLLELRCKHPEHPSRERAAADIGVSSKSLYEWEKRSGGIKWEHAKAAGAYYGVDPESLITREDEEAVSLQVLDGPRAEQLDRIEEKLDEILKRLSPPAEDGDEPGEGGAPAKLPDDPSLPPDSPDVAEPPSDEEDQRRTA